MESKLSRKFAAISHRLRLAASLTPLSAPGRLAQVLNRPLCGHPVDISFRNHSPKGGWLDECVDTEMSKDENIKKNRCVTSVRVAGLFFGDSILEMTGFRWVPNYFLPKIVCGRRRPPKQEFRSEDRRNTPLRNAAFKCQTFPPNKPSCQWTSPLRQSLSSLPH